MYFASVIFGFAGLGLSILSFLLVKMGPLGIIEVGGYMIILLVPLFYRLKKKVMYWIVICAALTVLVLLGVGIYIVVKWKDETECSIKNPFANDETDESDAPRTTEDNCNETLWAGLTFLGAACSAISGLCMYWFVRSGKYDEIETRYTEEFEAAEASKAAENPPDAEGRNPEEGP